MKQELRQQKTDFLHEGSNLSDMLLYLLEKRYLAPGDLHQMQLREDEKPGNGFLIREILEIGRSQERSDIRSVMPNILHACHSYGHALLMILHGQGKSQQVFLGGRRIIGKASGSTMNYVNSLESAFKTYYGGLRMGQPQKKESTGALMELLSSAGCASVITGIPSGKQPTDTRHLQSLDRLARAAGSGRYAMMVVADPVHPTEVDGLLDKFRKLKTEAHSLVRASFTDTHSSTRGTSVEIRDNESEDKTKMIKELGEFAMVAASFLGFPVLAVAGAVASELSSRRMDAHRQTPRETSQYSETNSGTESRETLNAHAEFCEKLIDEHIARLQSAKSNGWWNTAVYLVAENEQVLACLEGAVKSLCSGANSVLDPIRAIRLPVHAVRNSIMEGKALHLNFGNEGVHPLGEMYDYLATCMNSTELSTLVHLPINEIPGIRFRRHTEFSLSVPENLQKKKDIYLGTIYREENALMDVRMTLESLNRHAFITGMTGYGKTNTCMQILYEAYTKYKIPFLVIDPVKADYRNFLQLNELKGEFRVFGIGPVSALPLRLNPFELLPYKYIRNSPGFLAKHIDLLKAVFNASFPGMAGGPLAYILEDAIMEVYKAKGWNIFTSRNRHFKENGTEEEWYVLMPTLADLLPMVSTVFEKKKYAGEVTLNLKEGLTTRLGSLIDSTRGTVFNTRRCSKFSDLFDKPALIEIKDLGDNDDKAFVMALLFTFLYEYAEAKRGDSDDLLHLTLIEEAHRLLSAGDQKQSSDLADPKSKAVGMFTEMIAEMRGFGEGFLIADQSPSALNKNTIKNTNIKIIHRLAHSDDRKLAGDSVNLNLEQLNYLNNLDTGIAVMHEDRFEEAVQLRVYDFKQSRFEKLEEYQWEHLLEGMGKRVKEGSKTYLYRHSGCERCDNPCTYFYELAKEDFTHDKISRFADALLAGDTEQACRNLKDWQNEQGNDIETGILYCKAINALEQWATEWLTLRKSGIPWNIGSDELMKNRMLKALAKPLDLILNNASVENILSQISVKDFASRQFPVPPVEKEGCATCASRCTLKSVVERLMQNKISCDHITSGFKLNQKKYIDRYNPFSAGEVTNNWYHCVKTHWESAMKPGITLKNTI